MRAPTTTAATPGNTHSAPPPGDRTELPITESCDLRGRTVLLATNGGAESHAAAQVAGALARTHGARPRVVRAYGPELVVPLPVADVPTAVVTGFGDEVLDRAKYELRSELVRTVPGADDWPVHVVAGPAARSIVAEAEATRAALIVMGLRQRTPLQRALRDETALHVVRASPVPVLAVTAALTEAPRRIVVGVDFGSASRRAARAALAVLADGGTLILAHVAAPRLASTAAADEGAELIHRLGVTAAFAQLAEELTSVRKVTIETASLEGMVTLELSALAKRVRADAIAVGNQARDVVERVLLGSMTTELVRAGTWPLLIVPRVARAR